MQYQNIKAFNIKSFLRRNISNLILTSFIGLVFYFSLFTKYGVSPDAEVHLGFAAQGVQHVSLVGPLSNEFPIRYVHFYKSGWGYHIFLRFIGECLDFISAGSFREVHWFTLPYEYKQKWPPYESNLYDIGRILSVILTIFQVWILKLICNRIGTLRLYPVLIIWLAISLMYPLLSGNVTRDVLVNLLATAFLYSVFSYWQSYDSKYIKYGLICIAAAPLVLLSLAAFCVITVASLLIANFPLAMQACKDVIKVFRFKEGALFILLFSAFAIPSFLDVANKLYRYGSIHPPCDSIFPYEDCVSEHANFRIQQQIKENNTNNPRLDNLAYFSKWYPTLLRRILGITGHQSYNLPKIYARNLLILMTALFLVGASLAIKRRDRKFIFLTSISILFFVMVYFRNRGVYLSVGSFNVAMHGRYYFAAYPAFLLVMNYVFANCRLRYFTTYLLIILCILIYSYWGFFTNPSIHKLLII